MSQPKNEAEFNLIVAPEIIDVNPTTQIRVEIGQIGDHKGLSIRRWFRGTKDKTGPDKLKVGPWLPTKKGIWIPVEYRQELLKNIMLVIQAYEVKLQETL